MQLRVRFETSGGGGAAAGKGPAQPCQPARNALLTSRLQCTQLKRKPPLVSPLSKHIGGILNLHKGLTLTLLLSDSWQKQAKARSLFLEFDLEMQESNRSIAFRPRF